EIGVQHLVLEAGISPQFSDRIFIQLVVVLLFLETPLALRPERRTRSRRWIVDDEFVNDHAVQEWRLPERSRPILDVVFRSLGAGIDADLRDNSLSLPVPILDGRLRKVDLAGDDQRGDIRQDVVLEKLEIVATER